MDEYIKKEYAVDAVLDVYCDTPDIDLSCEKFEAAIFKIPPADVVPVRYGRWIQNYGLPNVKLCSACKTEREAKDCWWRYCPNCGAKMDLED